VGKIEGRKKSNLASTDPNDANYHYSENLQSTRDILLKILLEIEIFLITMRNKLMDPVGEIQSYLIINGWYTY